MRVRIRPIVKRPCIGRRAFVELPICSRVQAVPFPFVRGPVRHSYSASGRAGGNRTNSHAGRAGEGRILVVIVSIRLNPGADKVPNVNHRRHPTNRVVPDVCGRRDLPGIGIAARPQRAILCPSNLVPAGPSVCQEISVRWRSAVALA